MSNISFWHCGSNKPHATEFAIQNVRKHHPNAYYHLCVDGQNMEEFYKIAKRYDCDFVYYDRKLGGPVQPYGYDLSGVMEFLSRWHYAMARADSNYSHMIMMEDDVLVLKPITIEYGWEHACHNVKNDNFLPDELKKICEKMGIIPNFPSYGAGGGSIFKIDTFIKNYYRNIGLFEALIPHMHYRGYPTISWIDCFMNIYYYLSGKEYTINPHLVDTHNHRPGFDYDKFIENLSPEIEIVNNYKRLYFNE